MTKTVLHRTRELVAYNKDNPSEKYRLLFTWEVVEEGTYSGSTRYEREGSIRCLDEDNSYVNPTDEPGVYELTKYDLFSGKEEKIILNTNETDAP